jgi:3-dehydroquinate synthase
MEKVPVQSGSRPYDILIDCDWLSALGGTLKESGLLKGNVAVFTSPTIGGHYFEPVEASLREAGADRIGRHDVPDGEDNKSFENYRKAIDWLAGFAPRPDVEPLVVNLGGGVIGDLGGFVSATFRRGVACVQVPTTLLAAVDSSVGGKTAINLPEGKNLLGSFYQPFLVFMDLRVLDTLPEREVRSGMAEVIKYGAALDAGLFDYIEANVGRLSALEGDALMHVVPECCRLKAEVVRRDEYDKCSVRICLNFGHTVGHAIENACGYRLTHGECVAIGMVAAARLSVAMGLLARGDADRLTALLEQAGLPTDCKDLSLDPARVLDAMKRDKKFVRGSNRFVLLTAIGEWVEKEGVPEDLVVSTVEQSLL